MNILNQFFGNITTIKLVVLISFGKSIFLRKVLVDTVDHTIAQIDFEFSVSSWFLEFYELKFIHFCIRKKMFCVKNIYFGTNIHTRNTFAFSIEYCKFLYMLNSYSDIWYACFYDDDELIKEQSLKTDEYVRNYLTVKNKILYLYFSFLIFCLVHR